MVDDLFEHGGFKQAHDAGSCHDVPNDAGAVVGGGDSLGVVGVDANIRDATTVLLKGRLHNLSLVADLPDADLTFHATGDDAGAVVCWCQSGNAVVVCIVDGVEQTA